MNTMIGVKKEVIKANVKLTVKKGIKDLMFRSFKE
jgi:hypothetical protein